jgi:hypothetical protein
MTFSCTLTHSLTHTYTLLPQIESELQRSYDVLACWPSFALEAAVSEQ